ncbi:MAG: GIY-YIG nuclease family protein [Candidatus Omnitrophica bacterium]|nr:GIY-YIG nuclease family protein [Candidatus Omnitrophota bacterium]
MKFIIMVTKQDIVKAIQQTAKENGGIALGLGRFQKETGINEYKLQKFWRNFGEAQREAGFEPNILTPAHDLEFLLESLIAFMREIGRFPTQRDLTGKRYRDPKFPSPSSIIKRFGNKKGMVEKIADYAEKKGYSDIVEMCVSVVETPIEARDRETENGGVVGEVYLLKSGRYYKIGKTNDTVRRGKEIRVQLPERTDLIHAIKTDDPSGVEAYWHKRFESKRMQGE